MTMANKFINLEEIVLNWAWKQYDKTATTRKQKTLRKKEKNCPKKYISINIDWSQVRSDNLYKDVLELLLS